MQLLLFRHGIAEPRAEGTPDADRPLTPRGIGRTTQAAHGLARIADRPDVILTSPKVRAQQTAAILGETFDLHPEICNVLADGSVLEIAQALRDRTESRVMLVGHEPAMSELVVWLCGGSADRFAVELKKASCCLIEGPICRDESPGPMILRWLLPPRVLRTLAEG